MCSRLKHRGGSVFLAQIAAGDLQIPIISQLPPPEFPLCDHLDRVRCKWNASTQRSGVSG